MARGGDRVGKLVLFQRILVSILSFGGICFPCRSDFRRSRKVVTRYQTSVSIMTVVMCREAFSLYYRVHTYTMGFRISGPCLSPPCPGCLHGHGWASRIWCLSLEDSSRLTRSLRLFLQLCYCRESFPSGGTAQPLPAPRFS